MKYLFIAFLLLPGCYSRPKNVESEELKGKVIKIVDGDTYDILLDNRATLRIRMEGIDAPEKGMAFYKVAKDYLAQLCFGKEVRLVKTKTDKYGRTIAKTFIDDRRELGLLMVEAGYAWHFKKYSSDLKLADAEIRARAAQVGLWADKTPVAPWNWRRGRRKL